MNSILIIDDDKEVLGITKTRLQKQGYRVLTAPSGDEGLFLAVQKKPDLILLDIVMPGKDGFAVLKELKDSNVTRHIPVIMLTAKSETASIVNSQHEGAIDYFIKPLNWEELLRYIRKYMALVCEQV